MENFRSKKDQATCCRKHPKHRQSPGVCSLCLKEKLSRLSTSSSSRCTTIASACSSSSSSLSSYCSSASSSCASSPMHHRYRFPKKGKDGFSLLLVSGKDVLTKSRSVAFGSILRGKEVKKDKTGFLSKLLHPRRVH